MNRDWKNYVRKRCETVLLDDVEYIKKEQDEKTDQNELQEIAETICYEKGFIDGLKMALKMMH